MSDELAQAQQQFGKTIARAAAGEDRELASSVRDLGEQLARQLYGVLRLIRLHSLDNNAYDKPIADLVGTLTQLIDLLGAVHLVTVESQVYVNDIRVRMDERNDAGRNLGVELRRHAIGGVTFHAPPSAAHVRHLVRAFSAAPDPDRPRTHLQAELTARGLTEVEMVGVFRFRVSGERTAERHTDSRKTTRRAVELVDAAMDNLGASRMPNPLPLRRVVTDLLDAGGDTGGLWDEQDSGSRFSAHTMRVTLIALSLGRGIGMADAALQDLGVSAMFHDVGYASREGAQPASNESPAQPGYAPPFERHAAAGTRLLLRQRGFHEARIHRALSTLYHHRDHDDPRGRPTLAARILHIAEAYDNLQRADGGNCSPPEALGRMLSHAGTWYDPLLLKALVNTLGAYPPGTRLRLTDGRTVRSDSMVRDPDTFDKPRCVVLFDEDGGIPEGRVLMDLAEGGEVAEVIAG